jgi:threonine/homoserine/homoserine lactone efflux protein
VRNFGEFVLLVSALVAIPGPAVTLVFKNAVASGPRSALAVSLGVFSADLVWVAASVVGITAIVVASGVAFDALRLVGAAYLVYLGIRLLLNRGVDDDPASAVRSRDRCAGRSPRASSATSPTRRPHWCSRA